MQVKADNGKWSSESVRAQLPTAIAGLRYECPCGADWRLESGRTRRASAAEDEQTDGDGVRVENGHTDTGHGFVFRRESDVD